MEKESMMRMRRRRRRRSCFCSSRSGSVNEAFFGYLSIFVFGLSFWKQKALYGKEAERERERKIRK